MAQKQDLQKINELIELMKENDLVELEIVDGQNKIHLKRPQPAAPAITQVQMPIPIATQPVAAPGAQTEQDDSLEDIKSPMVGTYYSSASPDSEPFITVGSKIQDDTVICIIEAMKVMNEIKAETSGTVVEVLCKAGEAIEYDQPLFKIKPD